VSLKRRCCGDRALASTQALVASIAEAVDGLNTFAVEPYKAAAA
jgi:hypothetical protein